MLQLSYSWMDVWFVTEGKIWLLKFKGVSVQLYIKLYRGKKFRHSYETHKNVVSEFDAWREVRHLHFITDPIECLQLRDLRMEIDPVSETLCSFVFFRIPDDGQSPRIQESQYYLPPSELFRIY
jgi:hypothetical protein